MMLKNMFLALLGELKKKIPKKRLTKIALLRTFSLCTWFSECTYMNLERTKSCWFLISEHSEEGRGSRNTRQHKPECVIVVSCIVLAGLTSEQLDCWSGWSGGVQERTRPRPRPAARSRALTHEPLGGIKLPPLYVL